MTRSLLNFLLFLLLPACTVTNSFKIGNLDCNHIVSTQLMGTAQIVECENGSQTYVNSFPGTAGLEPVEKAIEAGTIVGGGYAVMKNLPNTLHTDSIVRLRP